MKTKLKIFGKSVPLALLIVVMAGAGIGSAALVGYLSNSVDATMTVQSPITVEISEDGVTYDEENSVTLEGVFGGNTATIYVKTANNANNMIYGDIEATITSPGITCADITGFDITTTIGDTTYDTESVITLCDEIDYSNIKFVVAGTGTSKPHWAVGEVDVSQADITFDAAALGDYTFAMQIIPRTA